MYVFKICKDKKKCNKKIINCVYFFWVNGRTMRAIIYFIIPFVLPVQGEYLRIYIKNTSYIWMQCFVCSLYVMFIMLVINV